MSSIEAINGESPTPVQPNQIERDLVRNRRFTFGAAGLGVVTATGTLALGAEAAHLMETGLATGWVNPWLETSTNAWLVGVVGATWEGMLTGGLLLRGRQRAQRLIDQLTHQSPGLVSESLEAGKSMQLFGILPRGKVSYE